jgi:hypothetical protein
VDEIAGLLEPEALVALPSSYKSLGVHVKVIGSVNKTACSNLKVATYLSISEEEVKGLVLTEEELPYCEEKLYQGHNCDVQPLLHG